MQRLALFGGPKVRSKPFSSRPHINAQEHRAIKACLDTLAFSRFIGSPTPHVRKELRMTSAEVMRLKDFWSFMGGTNVRKFEALWAKAHRAPYAISVNSATSGLTTALLACGVQPNDEVITSPFTFTATATSIALARAVPVFADVDLETFCLDPEAVRKKSGSRVTALMPVHVLGNPGDFQELLSLARKKDWWVIEDSAQAAGGRYKGKALGGFGHAGVFSFQETKNVMTGEGGMITTRDSHVAERCRLIRNHGESIPTKADSERLIKEVAGANYRMTELTAALGWVQTQKLGMLNAIRRKNFIRLRRRLEAAAGEFLIPQRVTNPDTFSPYCAGFRWQPTRSGISRDRIAQALRAEGIPVATGYPRLLSENILFAHQIKGNGRDAFPNAARLQYHEYLGFFQVGWPNTETDMEDIARAFEKILAHKSALMSKNIAKRSGFVSGRL